MKAAITPNYGPANIIQLREVPTPGIQANQVLVRVRATPVTAGDRRLRSADFPGMSAPFGRLMLGIFAPRNAIQGTVFAGQIVALGSGVSAYKVGDNVFGSADHGAYAEYIVVDEDGPMARMPEGLSYEQAAETPYGAGTALHFLRDLAKVQPGEKVLVLGASGGVGRYAVQLARHMGAEVTGVASSRNEAFVRGLGADHFISYEKEDFTESTDRYDVIFDIADSVTFADCLRSLSGKGRYLTLYVSLRVLFQMALTRLIGGPKAIFSIALPGRQALKEIAALLAEGAIRSSVAKEFRLERIAAAHEEADKGQAQGGIVVTMAA